LTFGSSKKDSVRKVLKQANNIQTPSAQMIKKQAGIKPVRNHDAVEFTAEQPDDSVPQISIDEVFEPVPVPDNNIPMQDAQNPPLLSVPKRNLKTPNVPKTAARFIQDRKASTPKAEEKKPPVTKKELMKNCFGFDDSATDDDEESACKNDSVNFSPLQNVRNSFIQMTPANRVRNPSAPMSVMSNASKSSSLAITGPMRCNFKPPPKQSKVSRSIYKNKSLKPINQAIESHVQNEVSQLFDDPQEDQNCDEKEATDAFEVLGKVVQKGTKKKPLKTVTNTAPLAGRNKSKQSLIYEESKDGNKQLRSKRRQLSSDENQTSPAKDVSHNVSKTYEREALNCSISNVESPKKAKRNKKDRLFDQWATNQTHHFSEVDDFDLSFT